MPCLELSLPRVSRERKAALAEALTRAFCGATGHRAEIFGVRFFEYGPEETAVGGRLDGAAPYLHALLYCPRIPRASKQALATALTEACAPWKPVVHICEHPYDNVIVDGQLLSDAYEACRDRPFYYPLSSD